MIESLFLSAVAALGGSSNPSCREAYDDLEARYRGRAYHNLRHVESTLESYLFLADDLDPQSGAKVVLALCFHDAVYDPRTKDNEEKSGELARSSLSALGIEKEDVEEIERLILLTRDHRSEDPLGALVVDADLAILQTSAEEYDRYASAIRREYAFVSDEDYRAGRIRVLRSLLEREPLYVSPLMDETAARKNMLRELNLLRDSPVPSPS